MFIVKLIDLNSPLTKLGFKGFLFNIIMKQNR